MSPLPYAQQALRLARQAVEASVCGRRFLLPTDLPSEWTSRRAGVFLTLTRGSRVRACWGTLEPQRRHLAEEIVAVAHEVLTHDTRFPPVRREELPQLRLILTVVISPPQPALPAQIRPREHGVLVRCGRRSAVVLPHEGRTVRHMLTLAKQKAGISEAEPVEVYVFRVHSVQEPPRWYPPE